MFRQTVIGLIKLYQRTLSPDHGPLRLLGGVCCFQPTCSEYTKQAVERFGVIKGMFLGVKRVGRCHPYSVGGYDPLLTSYQLPVISDQLLKTDNCKLKTLQER